jgi:hypothetical protein
VACAADHNCYLPQKHAVAIFALNLTAVRASPDQGDREDDEEGQENEEVVVDAADEEDGQGD